MSLKCENECCNFQFHYLTPAGALICSAEPMTEKELIEADEYTAWLEKEMAGFDPEDCEPLYGDYARRW